MLRLSFGPGTSRLGPLQDSCSRQSDKPNEALGTTQLFFPRTAWKPVWPKCSAYYIHVLKCTLLTELTVSTGLWIAKTSKARITLASNNS